jgi:hypothetical protein
VVRRCVREEDKHVRRYMVALDVRFSNTWQFLQGSHSLGVHRPRLRNRELRSCLIGRDVLVILCDIIVALTRLFEMY